MGYEVQVKEVSAQHVAVVRKHASMATIGQDVQSGFAAIVQAASSAGVPIAGMPFLVMFDVIDEGSEGDIEIGFPVAKPFPGAGEVEGREDPPTTVASTVHRGPYDEVGPAYQAIQDWIHEHGHEIAGPPRELYLNDPREAGEDETLTEIRFPIR